MANSSSGGSGTSGVVWSGATGCVVALTPNQGPQGVTGVVRPQGPTGTVGSTGPQGCTGFYGNSGAYTGSWGATGSWGPRIPESITIEKNGFTYVVTGQTVTIKDFNKNIFASADFRENKILYNVRYADRWYYTNDSKSENFVPEQVKLEVDRIFRFSHLR